jgi:hypothetical protein
MGLSVLVLGCFPTNGIVVQYYMTIFNKEWRSMEKFASLTR